MISGRNYCVTVWRETRSRFKLQDTSSLLSRPRISRTRAADMEDILIVSSRHSQAAALWVSYLNTCFEQISKTRNKPPFRILCVGLEDVVGPSNISVALEEKMVHVKLQIVILCPQFLDHIYQNPGPGTALGRLLQPDRVLAMLLGVEESGVTEQHRAALISYQQWHRLPVKDQDESFVGDFLEVAMGVLARSWRQQANRTERASFSLLPKKVNEGQNKVIVLLNEPIEKEDQIKVTVDKNGERLDISTVRRKNPYTYHFQMPDSCLEVSMIVSVYVEKNGQALGCRQVKCESRMRELDQILRSSDNPLEFMCQTLGFSPGDREHLDNFLVTAFQRNLPPHFNLLQAMGMSHSHRTHGSHEEYPTLLHFSAKFGLEKLAWQLLECPGGDHACEVRNVCEMTPAEMAEAAGHTKLANALRGYMQMTEFTSMYSYLKIMSEGNAKPTGFGEVEYHRPRPLSETYQVPPSARTVMEQNYQVPPTARPFTPATPVTPITPITPIMPTTASQDTTDMGGYMEMHPSGTNIRSPFKHSLDFLDTVALSVKSLQTLTTRSVSPTQELVSSKSTSQNQLDQISMDSAQDERLLQTGVGLKKSQEQLNHGVQDELLEIINDFKNNVFTISEVENLVETWKNRNDVQQSFKDKQDQLNLMREEYERLQQHMKDHMKRPTPFDRIRNFFKGKSKDSKEGSPDPSSACTAEAAKAANTDSLPLCQRPASSLSLHSISSSSSSGRMSTLSGCSGTSMVDSGTEIEDRKLSSPYDFSKMSNMRGRIQNYEIPPAPRKFSPPRYIAVPVSMQPISTMPATMQPINAGTTIENRPPLPVPRKDLDNEDNYVTPEQTRSASLAPETISKCIDTKQKSHSLWSETEERISAIVSSSPVIAPQLYKSTGGSDAEYLMLEGESERATEGSISPNVNIHGREYMNMPYSIPQVLNAENSNSVKFSQLEENSSPCSADMPDYMNVMLPAAAVPPVPPRAPVRRNI